MCSMLKVFATVVFIVLVKGSFTGCHASLIGDDYEKEETEDFVRPEIYALNLHTDIHEGNFNFSANVKIKIKTLKATNTIELYSKNLTVENITLKNDLGVPIEIFNHEEVNEIIKINLNSSLTENKPYEVTIVYYGIFPDDFIVEDFEKKFLLLSFKSIKFRTICPSKDVYGVRSKYKIKIEHHVSFKATSNSEIETLVTSMSGNEDFVITKFRETDSIQASSLAIFVSNLEPLQNDNELKIEIYGKENEFYQNALSFAHDVILLSNSMFNTFYENSNLKVIALPSTISAISTLQLMILNQHEITFRTEETTTVHKNKILRVFTRGIAQQYFGNVLSMQNLNESFFTDGLVMFFDHYFATKLNDENVIPDIFITEVLQPILEIDSLHIAKSLSTITEETMEDVSEFRAQKTASILKMFQNIYGEEKFIKLINDLIIKYKFESVMFENFISEIEEENYASFFTSWFFNIGYPLVTVIRENSTHVKLTQECFLLYNLNCISCEQLWKIPIIYRSLNDDINSEIIWMDTEEIFVPIESDSFILNFNSIGYFRVNYPESVWSQLFNILKDEENFTKIPALNRATLIDDAMNLGFAGKLSYKILFDLLTYLKHENQLVVWKSAHEILNFLEMMLSNDEDLYTNFKKLLSKIILPLYEKYGNDVDEIENENVVAIEMRKIVTFWACKAEIQNCLNFVAENMEIFENLDKDIKFIVLCSGIRNVDVNIFKIYLEKMNETSNENKEDLINALACSENDSLVELIMSNLISDKRHVLIATTTNYKYGAKAAIKIFQSFIKIISKTESDFMLNNMVKRIYNEKCLSDVVVPIILNSLMIDGNLTSDEVAFYINMMNITANWLINNQEEISKWLDDYFEEKDTTTETTEITATENESTDDINITTESTTTDCGHCLNFSIILMIFSLKYLL